jgi:hypothetical protein
MKRMKRWMQTKMGQTVDQQTLQPEPKLINCLRTFPSNVYILFEDGTAIADDKIITKRNNTFLFVEES